MDARLIFKIFMSFVNVFLYGSKEKELLYRLHTLDLNLEENLVVETNKPPVEEEPLNVAGNWLVQFERDTLLLTFDNKLKVINMNGLLKNQSKLKSEFEFQFPIEGIGK